MSAVLDVLKRARELLSDPNHWTRRSFARNETGITVIVHDEGAVCWCALGAAFRYADRDSALEYLVVEQLSAAAGKSPVRVNDDDGYDAVLGMYDKAIANEEAQAS